MTPAINVARKAKISFTIHEYTHDTGSHAYGQEAAEKLNIEQGRIFKTLVTENENKEMSVAIVPVSSQLSLKMLAKATGSKKASMAPPGRVEAVTGYVLGGVSPLGQKRKLPTVIDESAKRYETIFVSAGRRGVEIELSPEDLTRLTTGKIACIC